MKNETNFIIRAYGKSELAMLYLPHHSKTSAMRTFRNWMRFNPRLRHITKTRLKYYTPSQVKKIVQELGEPF